PAGPDRSELLPGVGDGAFHLLFGFEKSVLDHVGSFVLRTGQPAVISVPIFSPLTALMMVSSPSAPKTSMGKRLSMQRLNAAASATRSPCRSASPTVMVSSLPAVGSTRGAAV